MESISHELGVVSVFFCKWKEGQIEEPLHSAHLELVRSVAILVFGPLGTWFLNLLLLDYYRDLESKYHSIK